MVFRQRRLLRVSFIIGGVVFYCREMSPDTRSCRLRKNVQFLMKFDRQSLRWMHCDRETLRGLRQRSLLRLEQISQQATRSIRPLWPRPLWRWRRDNWEHRVSSTQPPRSNSPRRPSLRPHIQTNRALLSLPPSSWNRRRTRSRLQRIQRTLSLSLQIHRTGIADQVRPRQVRRPSGSRPRPF